MVQTQTRPKENKKEKSGQPLHKFVIIGVGIWVLFVATFAIAFYRVSLSQKFDGLPFKTLTDSETQKPVSSY